MSNEGGGIVPAPSRKSYGEQFDELFPYYLSIGMSEEQYWDRDSTLVIAYRKANELSMERENQKLWLQGRYIYDALCAVSPILHAFAKKGTKASPYNKEPYSLTEKTAKKKQKSEEKFLYDKNRAWMDAFVSRNNKKYQKER